MTLAHGRLEERTLLAVAAPTVPWPFARQVLRLHRRRIDQHPRAVLTDEVVSAVTSLAPDQASPTALLRLWRTHWGIEIVQSQMTTPGLLTRWAGGDDLAELDLVVGPSDPIDQQLA